METSSLAEVNKVEEAHAEHEKEDNGRRNVEMAHISMGPLQKISFTVISSMEGFFYKLGFNIAKRPWMFIIGCTLITILCGSGLLRFTPENRPDKLWIPWNSQFVHDSDWLRNNFPSPIRFHYAILTVKNGDVLNSNVMQILVDLHDGVKKLQSASGKSYNDLCFRLPVIPTSLNSRRRKKRTANNNTFINWDSLDFDDEITEVESHDNSSQFDPSFVLGVEDYCKTLSSFEEECWESNLAEYWSFDKKLVANLTKEEILWKINTAQKSPIFGRPVIYASELGGVVLNETRHVVSAQAVMVRWFNQIRINQTALQEGKFVNDLGTGEVLDTANFQWEKELAAFLQSYRLPEGVELYFSTARSFGDISGSTIWEDASMFSIGFAIVFMYVIFMLGRFNAVEQRPMLSLAGLGCVGLAILVSYGICSLFKLIYGPVHNILPFLLMGIGIDDMFVITTTWNNLAHENKKLPLEERMGQALQHSGVSITVTSLTDFFAFACGASTVLPALQSFCLYAALGILATYVFQATFFVAWFSIDQKRIESHRNAFFPCYKHKDFRPNSCSRQNHAQAFLDKIYCKFLFKKFSKVLVLVFTLAMLGVNLYGNTCLRQEFNPILFLPQDSYLFQYFMARDKYFPNKGDEGFILLHNVSYPENLKNLDTLNQKLQEFPYIHEIDSWYTELRSYVQYHFKNDLTSNNLKKNQFEAYLGRFLFSPSGSKFRGRMKVDGNLTCGQPSSSILISNIGFKFKVFDSPEQQIPVMNKLKEIVNEFQTAIVQQENTRAFVWSFAFAGWETDEIITAEFYRNLILAMLCVMLTTLVLIADFRTSLMVLACVVFTLVNTAGSMNAWGLTIDTISTIDLVLAIGLCVDYAAHIGHAFMTCTGSRDERAKNAIVKMGPAVLNGGFSTFLAFVLLANSRSHVFITFYKIFFLVVFYGLYHGLVFLPVVCCLFGSLPYLSATKQNDKKIAEQNIPLAIHKEV